jgi:hypothetical protein
MSPLGLTRPFFGVLEDPRLNRHACPRSHSHLTIRRASPSTLYHEEIGVRYHPRRFIFLRRWRILPDNQLEVGWTYLCSRAPLFDFILPVFCLGVDRFVHLLIYLAQDDRPDKGQIIIRCGS